MRLFFSDMFSWWRETIWSSKARKTLAGSDGIIELSASGMRPLSPGISPDSDGQWFSDALAFKQAIKTALERKAVSLIVKDDRYIERSIAKQGLRASDFDTLVKLDIEQHTPFNRADIFTVALPKTQKSGEEGYGIIRKDFILPAVDCLKELKAKKVTALLEREDGYIQMDIKARQKQSRLSFMPIMFLLVVIAFIGTWGHVQFRHYEALEKLERDIAALNTTVAEVRQLNVERRQALDRLKALRALRTDVPAVTTIWEELSARLPDSAYLTDLKLSGKNLELAGFAKNASSILAAIEGSKSFSNAAFTGPVVNVPGKQLQRFSLTMSAHNE